MQWIRGGNEELAGSDNRKCLVGIPQNPTWLPSIQKSGTADASLSFCLHKTRMDRVTEEPPVTSKLVKSLRLIWRIPPEKFPEGCSKRGMHNDHFEHRPQRLSWSFRKKLAGS